MVYESNYRPHRNVYDDELMHYGVPGMKWGQTQSQNCGWYLRYECSSVE